MAWRRKLKLPGGHRVFFKADQPSGRYSFADESGKTPSSTEDGPLWFSVSDPVHLTPHGGAVSVRKDDGSGPFTVYVTAQDALILVTELGMDLAEGGRRYEVRQVEE